MKTPEHAYSLNVSFSFGLQHSQLNIIKNIITLTENIKLNGNFRRKHSVLNLCNQDKLKSYLDRDLWRLLGREWDGERDRDLDLDLDRVGDLWRVFSFSFSLSFFELRSGEVSLVSGTGGSDLGAFGISLLKNKELIYKHIQTITTGVTF